MNLTVNANLLIQLIFYFFSALLLFSACMVITSRYPVRGVLFLILGFFCSAVLWMLIQAEFLALVLIFVYVGAVMTLFLFVVMMLNLEIAKRFKGWVPLFPIGLLALGLLLIAMVYPLTTQLFSASVYHLTLQPENYSNTKALGAVLYTHYVYPFELAAVLLLAAIIAAISLTFRGRKANSKAQRIAQQIATHPKDRLRIIRHFPVEKK
ncbi:MAG: NADH-quinone oxidoreductase subunit J [Gammaproteobacteria bacterium]